MLDNINAAANSDSLELIEEHLTAQRTSAVCQTLVQVCQRIWGISIRNCVISDRFSPNFYLFFFFLTFLFNFISFLLSKWLWETSSCYEKMQASSVLELQHQFHHNIRTFKSTNHVVNKLEIFRHFVVSFRLAKLLNFITFRFMYWF